MSYPSIYLGPYLLATGIGIVAWWLAAWLKPCTGPKPSDPFHQVAELITAVILIGGGAFALLQKQGSFLLTMAGLAMLLYGSINTAGEMLRTRRLVGEVMVAESIVTAVLLLAIATGWFYFPAFD